MHVSSSKGPYGQFLLFGDSITEQSSSQERGWALMPALQTAYIRRLDVINRGFSGYNTSQALKALHEFMPSPAQAQLRFMTIFFGANDACLPGSQTHQHVPLSQYKQNLRDIAKHPLVVNQKPRLILVTPPPVDEYRLQEADFAKGITEIRRTADHTKKYADASREVGEELSLVVLDLWSIFMSKAGWHEGQRLPGSRMVPRSEVLGDLLHDGLHFNPAAYRIMYDELISTIQKEWPEQSTGNLSPELPNYEVAFK